MQRDIDTAFLTVVPLGTTFFQGSLISHEITHVIEGLETGEKALLLYNRRGSGRAWICADCAYFPVCPHCSIALAYHAYPSPQLVCHHCSYRSDTMLDCPECGGNTFHEVGIGIQKITNDLKALFPHRKIFRLDSDSGAKKSSFIQSGIEHDLIISTYSGLPLLHLEGMKAIIFLLFESDLTLPDYRMEEDLYHALEYAKKSGKSVYIQTYIPEHPLLKTLVEGNYKDFLHLMSAERKKYNYPPYSDFVTIRIHDSSKEKLENIKNKLVNKIETLKDETLFFAYEREVTDRSRGEWTSKLLLKGKNIAPFLEQLEVELIRNRSITLEWN